MHKYFVAKDEWVSKYKWAPIVDALTKKNETKEGKQITSFSKLGDNEIPKLIERIQALRTKKTPIGRVIVRRIKSMPIYKLVSENTNVLKMFKRTDWEGFSKYFNLKVHKVVGIAPTYIGFRPSEPLKSNTVINQALNDLLRIGYKYSAEVTKAISDAVNKDRVVFTGAFDSNSLHLKKIFSRNLSHTNKGFLSVQQIIDICFKSPDWFTVGKVDFNDPGELKYATNFNPKSYCGYYTEMLLRANKKGFTNSISSKLALNYYNMVRSIPMRNQSLWSLFAREKDVATSIESKEVTTRVVFSTEEYVTHFYGWIFQKIIKSIPNQHIHIDGEFNGKKGYNLYKRCMKFDYIMEADWSAFDSSIDKNYLIAACCMLFGSLVNNKQDMRMFFNVISSVVYKNVLLPPGVVVSLNRANPSGHPGVTAVNCFVNLIRWAIIGYEIYGDDFSQNMDIEVYGDDAIIMLKKHQNLKNIDKICEKYKFLSDPLVPNLVPSFVLNITDFEKPDFLKRHFSLKGIEWNKKKLINKLVYQSKKRTEAEQLELIYNYIMTGPNDPEMNRFLKDLAARIVHNLPYLNELNEKLLANLNDRDLSRFSPRTSVPVIDGFLFNFEQAKFSYNTYLPHHENKFLYELPPGVVEALHLSVSYSSFTKKIVKGKFIKWFNIITTLVDYSDFDKNYIFSKIEQKLSKLNSLSGL